MVDRLEYGVLQWFVHVESAAKEHLVKKITRSDVRDVRLWRERPQMWRERMMQEEYLYSKEELL